MPTAIAFDMDGVLIDSQPLHYQIDISVIESCGYPATHSTVTPFTGVSNPDRWPRYKKDLNLSQSVDELIQMQTKTLMETFTNADISPISGIPELLMFLQSQNIPCAVTSSSQHELINLVLKKCNIAQYFTHLISGEEVAAGKPAPDIYLKAAETFGLPPTRCIAIEDAATGIQAAKGAGFICIGYRNPSTHGQDFTLADYIIDEYSDVYSIVRGIL